MQEAVTAPTGGDNARGRWKDELAERTRKIKEKQAAEESAEAAASDADVVDAEESEEVEAAQQEKAKPSDQVQDLNKKQPPGKPEPAAKLIGKEAREKVESEVLGLVRQFQERLVAHAHEHDVTTRLDIRVKFSPSQGVEADATPRMPEKSVRKLQGSIASVDGKHAPQLILEL